jgi:hypothetical protein
MSLCSVCLTGGLYREFAGTVGVHLGRADPTAVYHLSRFRAHGPEITATFASHSNPTRICD